MQKSLDEQAQLTAEDSVNITNETKEIDFDIPRSISSFPHGKTYRINKPWNYFKRHWRGELPLAISFWINFIMVNLLIQLIITWYNDTCPIKNPVTAARVTIIVHVFRYFIVYPWQIIGAWRSCIHHISKYGKYFWSRIVQALVVIGVIATCGIISSSWPLYEGFYKIGFMKDKYADYTLKMVKDNSIIHLQGGLGFGVSRDVRDLLERYPFVDGIILDTSGGRIYEGREL